MVSLPSPTLDRRYLSSLHLVYLSPDDSSQGQQGRENLRVVRSLVGPLG